MSSRSTPGARYRFRSSSTSPNSVSTFRDPRRVSVRSTPSTPRTSTGRSSAARIEVRLHHDAQHLAALCSQHPFDLVQRCVHRLRALVRSSSSFFILCRDSQNGISLAIVAIRALVIRPRKLRFADRSGQGHRDQPREIDQVSIATEDPHPSPIHHPVCNLAEPRCQHPSQNPTTCGRG